MSSAEKQAVQQELQKYIASGTKEKAPGHIKTVNSKKPIEFALTINGLTPVEYQAVIEYVKSLRKEWNVAMNNLDLAIALLEDAKQLRKEHD